MVSLLSRRGLAAQTFALAATAFAITPDALAAIETKRGGRLGVFAIDTATGRTLAHRPDERFLMQSTFKGPLAAMVLARVDAHTERLENTIPYGPKDLRPASPVTAARVAQGRMTVGDLCRAILERSDNAAANLLLARVGGPASLTSFVRSLGDAVTHVDRYELVGGWSGIKDTTTPRAIAGLARTLVLGKALLPTSRTLLQSWMALNVPGRSRLRAAFPAHWPACDRTGTGDGICNDYAVAWPPGRAPLVMAVYHEARGMEMEAQEAILREAGSAIVAWASSPA